MIVYYMRQNQVPIKRNKFHNGREVMINACFFYNSSSLFFFPLENELQIAICNQIYFHRNPSEIFGNSMDCSPAHLRTILHSMLPNVELFDDNRHQTSGNSNKSILI